LLYKEIKTCDGILESMENMLGGFKRDLSDISGEIKSLQDQSISLSLRLANRKVRVVLS